MFICPYRIQAIEHGAPADEAGLKTGDFIIFVGTKNVVKMNKDDVLQLFR
jgi:C-terminal processing protease CtpA/Prc